MEEQEAPLEDVHEEIHHHAEHAREKWVMGVALSTALLAAVAAIASLLSGDNVNEAMYEQMLATDKWNYYQAEGIKSSVLETRIEVLNAEGKPLWDLPRKVEEYGKTREKLKKEATREEDSAQARMKRHHKFAQSVTWSQIAIAVSAIAVLTRQKWFWLVGLGFGAAGLYFLLWGAVR
jgi:hypothetical protein